MTREHSLKDALDQFTVSLLKLSQVIHNELSDPVVVQQNQATLPQTAVEQSTPAETTSEVDLELDGENRPWIEGLHASTKTQMNSPEIKGAKKWRWAKNISQEQKDAYHAQYPLGAAVETKSEPVANMPPVTGTTPLPGQSLPPTGNMPPVSNQAPVESDETAKLRIAITHKVKEITDFGLTFNDVKEIFTTEFKAAQNGDDITVGSVATEQYPALLDYLTNLHNTYVSAKEHIDGAYGIAGAQFKSYVDQTITPMYAKYNTNELSGVHYTQIASVLSEVQELHQTWVNWQNGN